VDGLQDVEGTATVLIFVLLLVRELRSFLGSGSGSTGGPASGRADEVLAAVDRRLRTLLTLMPGSAIRRHLQQLDDIHRMVTEIHQRRK
jgi:hypothetical protein